MSARLVFTPAWVKSRAPEPTPAPQNQGSSALDGHARSPAPAHRQEDRCRLAVNATPSSRIWQPDSDRNLRRSFAGEDRPGFPTPAAACYSTCTEALNLGKVTNSMIGRNLVEQAGPEVRLPRAKERRPPLRTIELEQSLLPIPRPAGSDALPIPRPTGLAAGPAFTSLCLALRADC